MKELQQTLLYIAYNLANQKQIITADALKQPLEWLTGDVQGLENGLEWLIENGYMLLNDKHEFSLSEFGEREAFQINKTRAREEFNRTISCGIESAAYLDYCKEIYGYRLPLFNMMDKEQLDYLFNSIPISAGDTILDLGCGAGGILGSLVDKYACRGIGIDQVNAAMVRGCSPKISYIEGDLDNLQDYHVKPGVTLAVDSLYFSNDLDLLLRRLHDVPGNRLYMYYSQYIFDETSKDEALLEKDYTRLARGLQRNWLSYRTIDYSANEQALYENSIKALPKYKEIMPGALYDKCWRESLGGRELCEKGLASRYLYIVD